MKTGITERYANIQEYIKGKISIKELSAILKISRQQAYRLIKRFQEEGIVGLEHKNKNKPSHNRCNKEQKQKILNLIKEKYYDCGPSYASELLKENEGIDINRETLRLWMKAEHLLIKQRKRKPYRQRRERKNAFGEMLQIDGCFDY